MKDETSNKNEYNALINTIFLTIINIDVKRSIQKYTYVRSFDKIKISHPDLLGKLSQQPVESSHAMRVWDDTHAPPKLILLRLKSGFKSGFSFI